MIFGVLENPLMQRTSPPEPPDENLFNKIFAWKPLSSHEEVGWLRL